MQTRFNGNVVPFADDATSTNRTVFGGTTQSDNIDDNLNADFKKGWEIVGLNDNPTREDFNAMGYTLGALTAYLYQMGIAEWNINQEYIQNSYCTGSDGKIYKALTGTSGTPNVGNNPTTDAVNWESIDSKFVKTTGNETISGVKTFSSFSITPSTAPSTDYQVANKKYVDDSLGVKTIATGTATFTATTNNINLTGIGIGVEIGDVIQISGANDAKNNSEFTIEVITDANNVIVNQAHANKGTSKNVVARSGDTGVTIKLLSKWYNADSTLGRGLVILTSSRALNTNYPNNTKRPIEVNLIIETAEGTKKLFATIDSYVVDVAYTPGLTNSKASGTITIPRSVNNYSFDTNGTDTLLSWTEIR